MTTASPRRVELLRRHRRDIVAELDLLNAGELWHPLSEYEYRGILLASLEEIDSELAGEDPPWRPDRD